MSRMETHFDDMDCGVLDVIVSFRHEGHLIHVCLLHFFALTERYDGNSQLEGHVRLSSSAVKAGCDPSEAHY